MSTRKYTRLNSKVFHLGAQNSGIKTRSKVQDFYELRNDCISKGYLFEDPEFPAEKSSVYFSEEPDQRFEWRRPHEIIINPHLFVAGATRFDIEQGLIGDCWLLAAMANLTLHEEIFKFVVPSDQGFGKNYAGIFHFRFWQYGRWVEVVVDDRLPTINGKPMFLRSSARNEFWSALLEKAYAKLHGSYEALDGGTSSEAMEDFTGGVSENFSLDNDNPNLYKILHKSYRQNSLLSCYITADPEELEARTKEGLVKGHAYSITNVQRLTVKTPRKTGLMPMLRLRNPWGGNAEWRGPWSDRSKEWILVSKEERNKEGIKADDDGEFWMSFKDFKENFSCVEICSLSPDAMIEGITLLGSHHMWKMSMFEGEWVKNTSAGGGCYNSGTFWCNPQYCITLVDPDSNDIDEYCTVIIALMQKNRRKQRKMGKGELAISFDIFHLKNPERLPRPLDQKFFKINRPIVRPPDYIYQREVCFRYRLKPGTYCIIPSTYEREEGEFIIRVFTETNHNMLQHDMEVGFNERSQISTIPSKHTDIRPMRKFFFDLAGEDIEVSWEELKDILDLITKDESYKEEFSKEVCRSMIAMMDQDRSGKLSFEEFQILWESIDHWRGVFQMYEKGHPGYIFAGDLRQALSSAGYHLNYRILNILVHRYGNKKGQITFNDFIMCAIRLKAMISAFREREVTVDIATFSIDEWVEKTVYS